MPAPPCSLSMAAGPDTPVRQKLATVSPDPLCIRRFNPGFELFAIAFIYEKQDHERQRKQSAKRMTDCSLGQRNGSGGRRTGSANVVDLPQGTSYSLRLSAPVDHDVPGQSRWHMFLVEIGAIYLVSLVQRVCMGPLDGAG